MNTGLEGNCEWNKLFFQSRQAYEQIHLTNYHGQPANALQLDSSSGSSGVIGYSVAAATLAGVAGYVAGKKNQKTEEDAFKSIF